MLDINIQFDLKNSNGRNMFANFKNEFANYFQNIGVGVDRRRRREQLHEFLKSS